MSASTIGSRIAIRCSAGSHDSRRTFVPVTPLPDGSGMTSGTLGPQDTTSWSFASSYQRTFSSDAAERAPHRRHAPGRGPDRDRAQHVGVVGAEPARHSVDRAVSQHPADVPHRRLSAARIAVEHRDGLQHQRDRDRRHADLAEGPAHDQGRCGPALGAPQRACSRRRQPDPSPSATCSAISRERRTPARRWRASCSDRCSSSRSISSRRRSAIARTSRSTSSRTTGALSHRMTVNAGVRYTLNFPSTEENDQAAVFNLETEQLEFLGRDGQPRAARRAAQAELRPTAGDGRTRHRQDRGARRVRGGLDRDGGHHDAVHDAGLSVPSDRVAADARQHHAGLHAGERARTCSRSR